jgi:hypothetical protein
MLLVSYVKNNAFPQPLSEAEETKHLQLMAEGDQVSRNLLVEHNLRLVAHIVKRLWTRTDVMIKTIDFEFSQQNRAANLILCSFDIQKAKSRKRY